MIMRVRSLQIRLFTLVLYIKREYLGHTINFKTRKHFKDKKSHYVPEDEDNILGKLSDSRYATLDAQFMV